MSNQPLSNIAAFIFVSIQILQRFCYLFNMEKSTQLQFLKRKYIELSQQYLLALKDGKSLQQIKDLSYVLDCINSEIKMLEAQVAKKLFVLTTPGQTYGLFNEA
jgi:hypothetical protein